MAENPRIIGRDLVESLFPLALGLGKHVMIGGIDAANDASIRFHERLGFERVAHFREVGRKFGRWLDVVFMQRFLDLPAPSGRDSSTAILLRIGFVTRLPMGRQEVTVGSDVTCREVPR